MVSGSHCFTPVEHRVMRIDLHNHTCYSRDSSNTFEDYRQFYTRGAFGVLAITDHGTIEGALEFKRRDDFPVIVGQEINTLEGEIIGLYLGESIPEGMTAWQSVSAVKSQGGLIYVPHPFLRGGGHPIHPEVLHCLVPFIDIIEAKNASIPFDSANVKAAEFASDHRILAGAGSDAHLPVEIGRAFAELSGSPDGLSKSPDLLLEFLRSAHLTARPLPLHEKAAHKVFFHSLRYLRYVNTCVISK